MVGKNQLISASELLLGLGVSQGLFIPDELALSSRLVERLVEEGRIRNKVVIHKYLLRDLEEKRQLIEYGLMLVVLGDMLGHPVFTYYRFKLLPLWFSKLSTCKRYMLQDFDVTDKIREH